MTILACLRHMPIKFLVCCIRNITHVLKGFFFFFYSLVLLLQSGITCGCLCAHVPREGDVNPEPGSKGGTASRT